MHGLVPLVIAAAALAACAATHPYFDPAKPHLTAEGFRNNYPHPEKGGFWRWKWEQWRDGVPRKLAEARAAAGLAAEDFFVLRHGETRRLERSQ